MNQQILEYKSQLLDSSALRYLVVPDNLYTGLGGDHEFESRLLF
jgi:hypothetical protein